MHVILKNAAFLEVKFAAKIKLELLTAQRDLALLERSDAYILHNPVVTGMLWWRTSRPMTTLEANQSMKARRYRGLIPEYSMVDAQIRTLQKLVNLPKTSLVSEFVLTEDEYKLALS